MEPPFEAMYYNTIDQINHVEWATTKLARQEWLRESIRSLWPAGLSTQLVHVAGTSGKGSVCSYLASGFALLGSAGSFTGPHIFDYNERFHINNQAVTHEDIVDTWEHIVLPHCVKLTMQGMSHSYMEVSILIALALFEKYHVQWAAVETGMGGRYDMTNALDAQVAIVTNVGNDHEDRLGSELWQRALEKGGICRPAKPLFTAARDPLTLSVLEAICRHMQSALTVVDAANVAEFKVLVQASFPAGVPEHSLLTGEHQYGNAALAFTVMKALFPQLADDALIRRIVQTSYMGRDQKLADGLVIDIAHNPDKMAAFLAEVADRFATAQKIFVIGLSGNRKPKEVFHSLVQLADVIIITAASYKGLSPAMIKDELETINTRGIPIAVIADPTQAVDEAKKLREANGVIFITGSTYTIDQSLNPDPYLKHMNATYGWRTL